MDGKKKRNDSGERNTHIFSRRAPMKQLRGEVSSCASSSSCRNSQNNNGQIAKKCRLERSLLTHMFFSLSCTESWIMATHIFTLHAFERFVVVFF